MLVSGMLLFFLFFFKQKTAYEMRISDWSSDVCSSDLSEDYLLWRFMPVKQANIIDDYTRLLVGEAGRQFTDAGIMGVLIGAEGRIRAANPAFLLRATGRHDAVITGRD